MVGRLRSKGKREPNGRPQRTYENPRAQVASQPHRNGLPEQFREYPEGGTKFGRLMLRGQITPAQHEAGQQYSELYYSCRAAEQAPSPDPKSPNYAGSMVSGAPNEMSDDKAVSSKKRFQAAFSAIDAARLQLAAMHFAVRDKAIVDNFDLKCLKLAMDRLIVHFGIDPKLEMVHRQKSTVQ